MPLPPAPFGQILRRVSGHRRIGSSRWPAESLKWAEAFRRPGRMGWIGSNGPSLSGCMPRLFSRSGAPWHVLEVRAKGGCLAKGR
ncbi:MAG: hypothetical protein CW342_12225 [Thermoactinomycetaceae bacterium]|nr:hypothetical protein [Thermoactinomycetaceae bacterium]